jgi:hypothetical protein
MGPAAAKLASRTCALQTLTWGCDKTVLPGPPKGTGQQ